MAEITTSAYQDLRDYMQANWKYIELRDAVGTAVLRIDPTDPRVTWTHVPGAQTLELSVTIKGSDAGIVIPQAFASSAVYKVATAGDAYSVENFSSSFTIQAAEDELRVKHQIQVPQV
jgi:hypothetical protein